MGRHHLLRSVVAAAAVCIGTAAPASAAEIGLFSWQPDASGSFTFGIDVLGDWPAELLLEDVFVEFTRSDGTGSTTGQAYFGAPPYVLDESSACAGATVDVGVASGSFQVQGFRESEECEGLAALPQDVVSATLRFSFDEALGTVTLASLVPQFDGGEPIGDAQLILFEAAAATAVPEPSTLTLMSVVLAGWACRRVRPAVRC